NKPYLIRVMETSVAFSDVVRERNRCAADLTSQFVSFETWETAIHRIHPPAKLPRSLINFQIFKGQKLFGWGFRLCNFVTHVTFLTPPFDARRLENVRIRRRLEIVRAKGRHRKLT